VTKIQEIRREYNEPFRDVVAGFAMMQYSKRCTAMALGIVPSYFDVYLKRYAPDVKFPLRKDLNESCVPKGRGWPKGKKRNKPVKYPDELLLSLVRQYKTCREFGKSGIHYTTVIKRFGSWKKAKNYA